jgi:predicted metalloprotease with PDZ domain
LQEVLRARCGLQTAQTAWRHIEEGFERGRRSGTGTTLTAEAEEMARTGAFHRVYWAGTAFAFEADVRLRQHHGGSMSLFRALALARVELSRAQDSTSAAEVLQILDQVTGAGFLEEMGRRYEARASFPATDYLTHERYAAVRREIMAPRVDECRSTVEPSR